MIKQIRQMNWPYIALLLAAVSASNACADQQVNIPAGSVIECTPYPSIKTLAEDVANKGGVLTIGSPIKCVVTKDQVVPMESQFFGQVVEGAVPNSYAFKWEGWLLEDGRSVRLSNAQREKPSTSQGQTGHLRLNFKNGLVASSSAN